MGDRSITFDGIKLDFLPVGGGGWEWGSLLDRTRTTVSATEIFFAVFRERNKRKH